MFTVVANMS